MHSIHEEPRLMPAGHGGNMSPHAHSCSLPEAALPPSAQSGAARWSFPQDPDRSSPWRRSPCSTSSCSCARRLDGGRRRDHDDRADRPARPRRRAAAHSLLATGVPAARRLLEDLHQPRHVLRRLRRRGAVEGVLLAPAAARVGVADDHHRRPADGRRHPAWPSSATCRRVFGRSWR